MHNHALALELAYIAVEESLRLGASYAEARFEHRSQEDVRTRDGRLVIARQSHDRGIGIRVLVRGTWAFVGVSEPNRHDVVVSAKRVVELARAAAILRDRRAGMVDVEPQRGAFRTSIERDPADVSLEDKLALLRQIDERLLETAQVVQARSHLRWNRTRKILVTSDGTEVDQDLVRTGVGYEATASDGTDFQTASYPSPSGVVAGMGWELIEGLPLLDRAPEVAGQAVAQLSAEVCPVQAGTLILDPRAVAAHLLQTSRMLEVDRILALEASGEPIVVPSNPASGFRLGSEHLHLQIDPARTGGAGSYGFDDEGVPGRPVALVEGGQVESLLTGREAARRLGHPQSTGSMRAASWTVRPQVRASNLVMGPGQAADVESLVSDTDAGVVIEGLRAVSLDPSSGEFLAVGERAWQVKQGKRERRLKNAAFRGRAVEFWQNLDAVGTHGDLQGHIDGPKGRPEQFLATGVVAPSARFRDVQLGAAELPRSDSVDLPMDVNETPAPEEAGS